MKPQDYLDEAMVALDEVLRYWRECKINAPPGLVAQVQKASNHIPRCPRDCGNSLPPGETICSYCEASDDDDSGG